MAQCCHYLLTPIEYIILALQLVLFHCLVGESPKIDKR